MSRYAIVSTRLTDFASCDTVVFSNDSLWAWGACELLLLSPAASVRSIVGVTYCEVDFPAKRPLKTRSAGTPNAALKCSVARRVNASRSPRDSGDWMAGAISWSLGTVNREGATSGGAYDCALFCPPKERKSWSST